MDSDPQDRPAIPHALFNTLGRILALLGIVFVCLEIYDNLDSLKRAASESSVAIILVASLVYTLALTTLSIAWMLLLSDYQGTRFRFIASHYCYARSQIAKYLPGNVFHYAGRYALSRSMGASDRAVVSATLEELLGIAAVFAVCGTFAAVLSGHQLQIREGIPLPVLSLLVAVALLAARGLLAVPLAGRFRLSGLSLRLLESWGLFLLFLLLSMLVMLLLTEQFRELAGFSQLATLAAAFSLSWLLGFLVPGAPGGIGVREATFILLLEPLGMDGVALAAVLQFRIVTMLGDIAFFVTTFFVSPGKVCEPR